MMFFLLFASFASAQHDMTGLTLTGAGDDWFMNQIGVQNSGLIEGSFFQIKSTSIDSHPFFLKNQWISGNVIFKGQKFENVNLRYHLEEDLLLTNDPTVPHKYNQPIHLYSKYIECFKISGYTFKRFNPSIIGFDEGFYEVIYSGDNLELIARHTASLEVLGQKATYRTDKSFLLLVGDEAHLVKNRLTWLRSMKPYKKELRTYMNQRNIRSLHTETNDSLSELTRFTENNLQLSQ